MATTTEVPNLIVPAGWELTPAGMSFNDMHALDAWLGVDADGNLAASPRESLPSEQHDTYDSLTSELTAMSPKVSSWKNLKIMQHDAEAAIADLTGNIAQLDAMEMIAAGKAADGLRAELASLLAVVPEMFTEADYVYDAPGDADPEYGILNVVNLAPLWDVDTRPEMLVEGLLVRGAHHSVFGAPDSGKTWLGLAAFALPLIRSGQTVVWVDKEMSRSDTVERLKALGAERELVAEHFVYLELPTVDGSSESRKRWVALLENTRPALVVADAQAGVLADADLSENATSDVLRWHAMYFEPARRAGATTVMLDHSGHDNKERERGASGKSGNAKVRLHVENVKPFDAKSVGEMRVTLRKNNLGAPVCGGKLGSSLTYRIGAGDDGFVFEPLMFAEDDIAADNASWAVLLDAVADAVKVAGPEGLTQRQLEGLVEGTAARIRDAAKRLASDVTSPIEAKAGVPPLSWTSERLARLGRAGGWCSCPSRGSTGRRIRPRSVVTRSRW